MYPVKESLVKTSDNGPSEIDSLQNEMHKALSEQFDLIHSIYERVDRLSVIPKSPPDKPEAGPYNGQPSPHTVVENMSSQLSLLLASNYKLR